MLATYVAQLRNQPVLYVSTAEEDAARAMLVLPPPDHVPLVPKTQFREASARGQWYAPWWGQRLDGKRDYMD